MISSWQDLQAAIAWFGDGFANSDYVFRGEPEVFGQCHSPIDRLFPEGAMSLETRLEVEWESMLRFRQHAPMHLDQIQWQVLSQGMQAQTVMRHYGVPTRLLDWSESPWVATFFACVDSLSSSKSSETPGRLLAFERQVVQAKVRDQHEASTKLHDASVRSVRGLDIPMILSHEFGRTAPTWVIGYHRHAEKFPRLVAQQGLFTLASKPWVDHWQTLKALCPLHHRELHIDPALKRTALRHLHRMGVTYATMFPGLEGVSRDVSAQLVLRYGLR